MKLHELNVIEPRRRLKQTSHNYLSGVSNAADAEERTAALENKPSRFNYKGSGSYANTFAPTRQTNTIVKVGRTDRGTTAKRDGYLSFVDQVVKHGKGNPFLPQIYDVKVFEDKDGRVVYKVKMEKLQHFGSTKDDEWWAFFQKVFDKGKEELILMYRFREGWLGTSFLNIVTDYITHEHSDRIQQLMNGADPAFRQALELIRTARESSNATPDIRPDNVMLRRTPYGIQPVFTDPLA